MMMTTFGSLGLAAAGFIGLIVCWRSLVYERRIRRMTQDEVSYLKTHLELTRTGLGVDSNVALLSYFTKLSSVLSQQISSLEHTMEASAAPFDWSEQESSQSPILQRRLRFTGYKDALLAANLNIGEFVSMLRDDLRCIEEIADRLNSHRLDCAMGTLEIEAVNKVLAHLKNELIDQWREELVTNRRKLEFDYVRKFREAMERHRPHKDPRHKAQAVVPDEEA